MQPGSTLGCFALCAHAGQFGAIRRVADDDAAGGGVGFGDELVQFLLAGDHAAACPDDLRAGFEIERVLRHHAKARRITDAGARRTSDAKERYAGERDCASKTAVSVNRHVVPRERDRPMVPHPVMSQPWVRRVRSADARAGTVSPRRLRGRTDRPAPRPAVPEWTYRPVRLRGGWYRHIVAPPRGPCRARPHSAPAHRRVCRPKGGWRKCPAI